MNQLKKLTILVSNIQKRQFCSNNQNLQYIQKQKLTDTLPLILTVGQLQEILQIHHQKIQNNSKEQQQQLQQQFGKYEHELTVSDVLQSLDDDFCQKIFQSKFPEWQHADNAKYVQGVEVEHVLSEVYQLGANKVVNILKLLDKNGLLMAVSQAHLMELTRCLTKTVGLHKMSLKIFLSRLDKPEENIKALTAQTQQIEYMYKSLQALGANQQQIIQLIIKYPIILKNLNIEVLQKNVIKIKQTQILRNIQDFFQLCVDIPVLFKKDISLKIEELNPFLRQELSLSQNEIESILIQNPVFFRQRSTSQIYIQSVDNYRLKFKMLKNQLGGGIGDIIAWPGYLTSTVHVKELQDRIDFCRQNGCQIIVPTKKFDFDINILQIIPLQFLVSRGMNFKVMFARRGLVYKPTK